jgi:hemerythrin
MPAAFQVHHNHIDEQHEYLFSIFVRINSAIDNDCVDITADILEELDKYVTFHFRFEENLMDKTNYPDQENHISAHRKLEEQIAIFKKTYLHSHEGEQSLPIEISSFLQSWLKNHIAMHDKKLVSFLAQNPLSKN